MIVYSVIDHRCSTNTKHSYLVGVYADLKLAIVVAEEQTTYRGGNYICDVEECELDKYDEDALDYTKTVYTTKIE